MGSQRVDTPERLNWTELIIHFKNQSPKFGHLYIEPNSLHITKSIAVESLVHNYFHLLRGIIIQLLNCICLFVTSWTATHQASLSFTIFLSLLRLMSIESVMPSNHLTLCCPCLFCPQSLPAFSVFSTESALCIRWQSIGASASVLPMNIQDWFSLELTGLISLLSEGCSRFFSKTTVQKHKFFSVQPSLWSYSHIHIWLLGKNHSLD